MKLSSHLHTYVKESECHSHSQRSPLSFRWIFQDAKELKTQINLSGTKIQNRTNSLGEKKFNDCLHSSTAEGRGHREHENSWTLASSKRCKKPNTRFAPRATDKTANFTGPPTVYHGFLQVPQTWVQSKRAEPQHLLLEPEKG